MGSDTRRSSDVLLVPHIVSRRSGVYSRVSAQHSFPLFHSPQRPHHSNVSRCSSRAHCAALSMRTFLSTLSPLPGVRAIDLSSVPGHVLVDIDTDVLSAQHLVESVRRLWHNEDACLVEPMQSCISGWSARPRRSSVRRPGRPGALAPTAAGRSYGHRRDSELSRSIWRSRSHLVDNCRPVAIDDQHQPLSIQWPSRIAGIVEKILR